MDMTQLQAIRIFASQVANCHVTIAKHRKYWGMDVNDTMPRLILPPDLKVKDEEDRAFRKNFISRCPLAQGFSDVTISILHEIGHYFTKEYLTFEYYAEADNISGEAYFNLPAEKVATDWAINWLQDSTNRKIAKVFEKQFFHAKY